MNKTTMDFLLAHGYKKVTADGIKEILIQGNIKGLHIEVTLAEPFMLLARVKKNNAIIGYERMDENSPEYLVIMMIDKFRTRLFDIPLNSIKDMLVNIGPAMVDIIFSLSTDNNSYRILFKNDK